MLRAIWYLFILAGLAASAMWLADNPGSVNLQWQGYNIETSAAMLIAAFAMVAFGAAVLYRLWVFLRGVPAGIGRARQEARRRRGYLALTRGMVAVAAGDASEARRQGSRADGLLGDPSLTMLLSAQAAQLNGDEKAAEKFFTAMLERPEMEFLGLRGLLSQATRSGDTDQALTWARRAYALKPKSEWLGATLFDLLTRGGLWLEASTTLAGAIGNKLVSPVQARRRQAVLSHLLSLDAEATGDPLVALKKAKKAFDDKPGFVPGAVQYAHLLVAAGKRRKALTVLQGAWRNQPHPDLAEAYWQAAAPKDVLAKMTAAQKLCAGNADHPESYITLAAVALEAELWGDARENLRKRVEIPDLPVTVAICRMMVDLEERENNDLAAAREWLFRAGNATPDPVWVCRECGNTTRHWTPLCGKCQGFDGFEWSRPLNVPALVSTPPAAAAALEASGARDEERDVAGTETPDAALLLDPPPAFITKKTDRNSSQDIDEKSAGQ